MRILFDSKKEEFKSPFGTLTPGQVCALQICVPESVQATKVVCILQAENGEPVQETELTRPGRLRYFPRQLFSPPPRPLLLLFPGLEG